MPTRPPNNCLTPGCPELTTSGHCTTHQPRYPRSNLYNTRRWRTLRHSVLLEQPICTIEGCDRIATDVDHITALRNNGDPWSRTNLTALCKPCHSRKTAHEVSLGHR